MRSTFLKPEDLPVERRHLSDLMAQRHERASKGDDPHHQTLEMLDERIAIVSARIAEVEAFLQGQAPATGNGGVPPRNLTEEAAANAIVALHKRMRTGAVRQKP